MMMMMMMAANIIIVVVVLHFAPPSGCSCPSLKVLMPPLPSPPLLVRAQGGYKPLNRNGIESACSALQKMTFETTTHFLTQAAIHRDADTLGSPSASVVLGKAPRTGTGAFEVRSTPNFGHTPPAQPAAAAAAAAAVAATAAAAANSAAEAAAAAAKKRKPNSDRPPKVASARGAK